MFLLLVTALFVKPAHGLACCSRPRTPLALTELSASGPSWLSATTSPSLSLSLAQNMSPGWSCLTSFSFDTLKLIAQQCCQRRNRPVQQERQGCPVGKLQTSISLAAVSDCLLIVTQERYNTDEMASQFLEMFKDCVFSVGQVWIDPTRYSASN